MRGHVIYFENIVDYALFIQYGGQMTLNQKGEVDFFDTPGP